MSERKKTKPTAIKCILEQFFKEHEGQRELLQSQIVKYWDQIMPEGSGEYTRPITIKNKQLIIGVTNSAWLHEVTLNKNTIIKNLEKLIKTEDIIDIRFKISV